MTSGLDRPLRALSRLAPQISKIGRRGRKARAKNERILAGFESVSTKRLTIRLSADRERDVAKQRKKLAARGSASVVAVAPSRDPGTSSIAEGVSAE